MVSLNTGLDREDKGVYITIHATDQQLPIGEEFEMEDTRPLFTADEKVLSLVLHALIKTHDGSIATPCVHKVLTSIDR